MSTKVKEVRKKKGNSLTYASCNNLIPHNNASSYAPEDILRVLLSDGTINVGDVLTKMKQNEKEEMLSKHEHKIWHGKDGRWRTYVPDETKPKNRRLVSKGSEDDLLELLVDYYGNKKGTQKRKTVTLKSFFPVYIEEKSGRCEQATIERNKRTWEELFEGTSIVSKPLIGLSDQDIREWVNKVIKEKKLNKHGYVRFKSVLGQMLDSITERYEIEFNLNKIFDYHKRAKLQPEYKKPDEGQVFTEGEEAAIIRHAYVMYKRHRNKVQEFVPLAIAFLFYTSLRRGELTAIRFEDIEGRNLYIKRAYSTDGHCISSVKDKNNYRIEALVPSALEIINLVKEERIRMGLPVTGYIFTVNSELGSFYSRVYKELIDYCDTLGIERKGIHKTRKTTGSKMVDNANINSARVFLGHRDEVTTLNNYTYDRKTEEERYQQKSEALTVVEFSDILAEESNHPSNHFSKKEPL